MASLQDPSSPALLNTKYGAVHIKSTGNIPKTKAKKLKNTVLK
jgi:hypothetical protein